MFGEKKGDKSRLPDLPGASKQSGQKVPDLPPLPELPEDESYEKHSLPSFPDSPMGKSFSQAAIKDAVDSEEIIPGEENDESANIVEMDEWRPPKTAVIPSAPDSGQRFEDFDSLQQKIASRAGPLNLTQRNRDVFVRLDKFHSAKMTLAEIGVKLEEINELVKKIREMKIREEQELNNWEKDIMQIKSRIREVTQNIFEKVD
jgi:hypothetical protein